MKTIYLNLSKHSEIERPIIWATIVVNHDLEKSYTDISNILLSLSQKRESFRLHFHASLYKDTVTHLQIDKEKRIRKLRSK
jgi:hypothetical protein